MYKYQAEQSNYGEEEREVLFLSTDVNWHCESSKINSATFVHIAIYVAIPFVRWHVW